MSVKAVAVAYALDEQARESINVSAVCREEGVSRAVFYKYVNRVSREGLDGLTERSRRPRSSPQQTPVEVEDWVVRLRKELDDAGLDHGATSIQWHLGRRDVPVVPSVATIHRILVRRGLVIPEPKKRPKAAYKRFEVPAPNEMWQIDHTEWEIATGVVKIFSIIDDHSRVAIRSRAVTEATSEEAWTTFCEGAQTWGLPAGTLSDNGLCFSGKIRQVEVFFETKLRDSGVRPITSRPFHPQTAGKVERYQQTLKKWLRKTAPGRRHHRASSPTRYLYWYLQHRATSPRDRPADPDQSLASHPSGRACQRTARSPRLVIKDPTRHRHQNRVCASRQLPDPHRGRTPRPHSPGDHRLQTSEHLHQR